MIRSSSRARETTNGAMMTGEEFKQALHDLDWKQSDFCRKTGVHRNSASGWATEGAPQWAAEYLRAILAIKGLYAAFILPPPRERQSSAAATLPDEIAKN